MIDTIIRELEINNSELIKLISGLDKDLINMRPYESCWTPGQLSCHLIKSNSGFAEILNGPLKDLDGLYNENGNPRKPDDLVDIIRETFLNFEVKFQSPDFVVPEDKIYDKFFLLFTLNKIHKDLIVAVTSKDLTKLCISFEIPVLGYLTGLEAVNFVIYHTRRHINQLENIINQLRVKGRQYAKN